MKQTRLLQACFENEHRTHGIYTMLALSALLLLPVGPLGAAGFSTDFESRQLATPQTFTETDGTLSVDFAGGTANTRFIGALYRSGVVSWMLEPVGVNNSTGTATATLSEAAPYVRFYAIHQQGTNTTSTIEFLDAAGTTVLGQTMNVGETFTEVELSQVTGDPLIKSVRVTHNGGTGMIAIDDFEYSTDVQSSDPGDGDSDDDTDDDDSDSTAFGWMWLSFLIAALLGRGACAWQRQRG